MSTNRCTEPRCAVGVAKLLRTNRHSVFLYAIVLIAVSSCAACRYKGLEKQRQKMTAAAAENAVK